jgi:hypothetical protein
MLRARLPRAACLGLIEAIRMPSLRALPVLTAMALFGCAANEPAAPRQEAPFSGQNTRFSWKGQLTQGGFIQALAPDGAVAVSVGNTPIELAPDGIFFAAFDRDSPTSVTLTARLDSGQMHAETLTITPRKWQIEHAKVAKRSSGSDEAYWEIREPEFNAINAARAQKTGATGWRQDFIWPVKGRISGQFGRQRFYNGEPGAFHSGIDIAPGNGVPFVTPADGVVVLARTGFSLEGGLIIIDHGSGLNSAFLHASRIVVREGERVVQGQHIGNVGATGRATGPHLHWSLKWGDARLDRRTDELTCAAGAG